MLKKSLLPAAVAATLVAGATTSQVANAEFAIEGNVALVSDYRFRGISQSDESVAIQGGFDAGWDSGFYVGVWGSSVDFDSNDGFDGSLELDYYAGWGTDLSDSTSIDVGYLYYDYPGDDGAEGDYQELYASFSWSDLTIGGAYSDDYYGETGTFYYLYADYGLTLPGDFGLSFHVGYNDLDDKGGFLAADPITGKNEDSYVDYSIGLTKEWASVEWGLAWVGTDLDEEDVFDTDWGEDTIVFSVAKSL